MKKSAHKRFPLFVLGRGNDHKKEKTLTFKSKSFIFIPAVWLVSNFVLIIVVSVMLLNMQTKTQEPIKYSIFSSKPLVLGTNDAKITSSSQKAAALNKTFEEFGCPMTGLGEVFVEEAENNGIPYWLVAAISFQESNCGKKLPKDNGDQTKTYNAWGWGVWGENVMNFDSWEHGIRSVSQYMGERFYSQGITDPCDIMQVYTPPSDGSWSEGVQYFGDLIVANEPTTL